MRLQPIFFIVSMRRDNDLLIDIKNFFPVIRFSQLQAPPSKIVGLKLRDIGLVASLDAGPAGAEKKNI